MHEMVQTCEDDHPADHFQYLHEPCLVRASQVQDQPLWLVILASWGLALFEYVFQVPANQLGFDQWSVPQLKVLQECITFVVFTVVAYVLFRSPIRWNIGVAYLCIVAAVYFAFLPR
jgi:uncharacterized protein (DUF486 family)